jgi:DNA-binding NarL/FixJ family response regulator
MRPWKPVMIRLLIVDDHQETRSTIISHLAEEGLIQIIGEAETSDQALKMSEQLHPDIVLLDLHLPGLIPSIDLVKRLTALRNVKVIAFASETKAADVQDVLGAGAAGYVLKNDPPALLRMSLLMVSRGSKNILSPSLPRNVARLSNQERSLLKEVTKRGGIPKAAGRLNLSEGELSGALTELSEKLELQDLEALLKWAKKNGF